MTVIFLSLHSINVDVEFSVYVIHDRVLEMAWLKFWYPLFYYMEAGKTYTLDTMEFEPFTGMRTLDFNNLFGVYVNSE